MAKAKVTLHKIVVDSQEYGSTDEYMVSRVSLTVSINGQKYDGYSDVKL